jgi:hypothetical protein
MVAHAQVLDEKAASADRPFSSSEHPTRPEIVKPKIPRT